MLAEHFELIENIGLDFLISGIFFFIAMAIRDVLNQANVPTYGRRIVWLILFAGCFGFILKGIIHLYWQLTGL